jgi:hypothetical protein
VVLRLGMENRLRTMSVSGDVQRIAWRSRS